MTMASRATRMITMREFRNTFQTLTEPVKVVRSRGEVKVLGTWTPAKQEKAEPRAD